MSRCIDLWYYPPGSEDRTEIEVPAPYFFLGTQSLSLQIWSMPALREIGVRHLTLLGDSDPVYFVGWEILEELGRELTLLQANACNIDFDPGLTAEWIAHLTYCYLLLVRLTSNDATPWLMIG